MVGETISHYHIFEKLGEGGMGEVYRAEDTKLKREVAIKVLPQQFTQDPQRLARFAREAQLLASLNHPNIAAIYGLEEADGVRFLVLELVEGVTLAERVAKGPLPVEEALEVCCQIAEGVEAAHEKGVIHRDLKPANVKITPEGQVKVLDFGLAKAFQRETPVADISHSPTLTEEMTRSGVILGTAGYMSPEQARGKPVDKRTDIWAFGCVVYEMLSGKRTFEGEMVSDMMAVILRTEPDWDALPKKTPWKVRDLLRRCLQKDPLSRLRDIGDARIEIGEALTEPSEDSAMVKLVPGGLSQRVVSWSVAAAFALGAIVAGLTVWRITRPAPLPAAPPKHLAITLPPTAPMEIETWRPALAISPDGNRLVYVANRGGKRQLYLRQMDDQEALPIPGTEDGYSPFFSPDGESIGFFAGWELKKVSLSGGPPVTLRGVPPVTRGATWGPDDTIIFTSNPNGGFARISAIGGPLPNDAFSDAPIRERGEQLLTSADREQGEYSHRWPEFLPGGKAVLFTVDTGGSFDNASIAVLSLESGDTKVLFPGGTNARYSPTGHIVFAQAGSLLAVPFDLERLEVTGPSVSILDGVMMEPGGAAHFTLSRDGSLVYVPGGLLVPDRKLVWVDRLGNVEPLLAEPKGYMTPSVSPDGQHVAVTIREGSNYDIWVVEVRRGTLNPLTSHPGEDFDPIWTPDGKRVTFASEMAEGQKGPALWWRPADADGPAEPVQVRSSDLLWKFPTSWSPDGQTVIFNAIDTEIKNGIWTQSIETEAEAREFHVTEFDESSAMFSPNGRWLAFVSNQSGRHEVYVKAFGGSGGMKRASVEGGTEPVWVADGSEIYYRNGEKMMATAVETGAELKIGDPEMLFEGRFLPTGRPDARRNYDIAPDGRFLMIKREQDVTPTEFSILLNWFEELKRLVPTGK
ncbi:protein kinase [Acidobacteria bacterium AH-259-O06]|nr:protein kinase [Acidobacteria bacterium AH-259-O06]